MRFIHLFKRCLILGLLLFIICGSADAMIDEFYLEKTSDDLSTIWYVDDDGDADFNCIQDALNASNDGDTIFVYEGVYYELLNIDTEINLIGENQNNTIIDGMFLGEPVRIWSSNVTFQGFTVKNSIHTAYSTGIMVIGRNVLVSNCLVEGNDCGFRIELTDHVTVKNCIIRFNDGPSIYNIVSSHILIENCTMYQNGDHSDPVAGDICIATEYGQETQSNITIRYCTLFDEIINAISIGDPWTDLGYEKVLIEHNTIMNISEEAIIVWRSDVVIRENVFVDNGWDGRSNTFVSAIMLQDCMGLVTIERNHFEHNFRGVYLLRSNENVIQNNNFIDNKRQVGFEYKTGLSNKWSGNYFDNQILPGMKVFFGFIANKLYLPMLDFDFHTVSKPYEI